LRHKNHFSHLFEDNCLLIVLWSILLLSGCSANLFVIPELDNSIDSTGFQIKGKIKDYEGNREYLPRTLADDPTSNPPLYFQFEYQVIYGKDDTHQAVYLFNPLSLVGFPIGEDTLLVEGRLRIFSENGLMKDYRATCGFQKARSLFSEGETFSELRRKGLLKVRDNIETQMCLDRDFLLNLVKEKGD
jgi:hypothetical protein